MTMIQTNTATCVTNEETIRRHLSYFGVTLGKLPETQEEDPLTITATWHTRVERRDVTMRLPFTIKPAFNADGDRLRSHGGDPLYAFTTPTFGA